MSETVPAAAEAAPDAGTKVEAQAEAQAEAAPSPSAPRSGWLKSLEGRFHEVDDIDRTIEAYPGQYEEVEASKVKKNLIGWADPNPEES